jgi:hypothetical protein
VDDRDDSEGVRTQLTQQPTARNRARRQYRFLLAWVVLGGLLFGVSQESESGALAVGGATVATVGLIVTAVILNSWRCPHCRRRIDLRGADAFCPKCGVAIPAEDGGNSQTRTN